MDGSTGDPREPLQTSLNLPPLTSTSPAATLRRERHPLTHPLETQLPSTRLFGHRERLWAVALAGGTAWPTDNAEDIDNYLAPGQKPTSVWSPSRLGWGETERTIDTPTTSRGRRRRRRPMSPTETKSARPDGALPKRRRRATALQRLKRSDRPGERAWTHPL